jgi:fucose permease
MYFISYYAVLNQQFPPLITSVVLPVFCVFIIGLIIGCMFSNVYTAAVDSLLYCYLMERKSISEGA